MSQPIIFKLREGKNRKTGKKFFTYTIVHTNKNVANHKYNTKATRDKQLAAFTDAMKKGNFKIQ